MPWGFSCGISRCAQKLGLTPNALLEKCTLCQELHTPRLESPVRAICQIFLQASATRRCARSWEHKCTAISLAGRGLLHAVLLILDTSRGRFMICQSQVQKDQPMLQEWLYLPFSAHLPPSHLSFHLSHPSVGRKSLLELFKVPKAGKNLSNLHGHVPSSPLPQLLHSPSYWCFPHCLGGGRNFRATSAHSSESVQGMCSPGNRTVQQERWVGGWVPSGCPVSPSPPLCRHRERNPTCCCCYYFQ